jgi:hypothetical protein
MHCAEENRVYELAAGRLSSEDAARLRHHLTSCALCAKLNAELEQITKRLEIEPGELADSEMDEAILTLVRLDRAGRAVERDSVRRWKSYGVAALAAAACVALFFTLRPRSAPIVQNSTEFYARDGAGRRENQWVSIEIFRATESQYEPVKGRINADDALAFSYVNRNNPAFRFLLIFAVDKSGRVFWYYPSYTDRDANPTSIPIKKTVEPVALAEEVQHDLSSGRLRLFAVFSMSALDVGAIEDTVARELRNGRTLANLDRLDLPETGQHSFLLTVAPNAKGGVTR